VMPVVSVVGKSGVGKTALIERVVRELKRRRYRIATVKHSLHGVDIDSPGKDSWIFARAGSDAVVISSPDKLVLIKGVDHDPGIEEILLTVGGGYDLVLVEGLRKSKAAKIEVHRKELGDDLLCSTKELSAIVTDGSLDVNVPQLPIGDTQAIADFIEKTFVLGSERDTLVLVNGKQVSMKPFAKDIIAETALAMVSTLKGVTKVRTLDISVRNKCGPSTPRGRSDERMGGTGEVSRRDT
jgi:molybdopterin-guanine dinucleotide biosynthesis protein B